MPRHPLQREAGLSSAVASASWSHRFWAELKTTSERDDIVVRLIAIERIARSVVLAALAVAIIYLGSKGTLYTWAQTAQTELNLSAGHGLIRRLLDLLLVRLANFRHIDVAAIGVLAYCALELTEGIGLWLRRRWAEYLTALATAIFVPFEVLELLRHLTLLRAGALLINLAIVVYLVWSKRLFMDV